jgi:hypothetical protein
MRYVALVVSVPLILACGVSVTPIATRIPAVISRQEYVKPADMRTVTEPLTIRQEPCVPSLVIGYLSAGDSVHITNERVHCDDGGAWVELERGGWVNERFIR